MNVYDIKSLKAIHEILQILIYKYDVVNSETNNIVIADQYIAKEIENQKERKTI